MANLEKPKMGKLFNEPVDTLCTVHILHPFIHTFDVGTHKPGILPPSDESTDE